jgi:magnesium transporter
MNFENMPELKWQNGYFGVWGVMIVLAILMLAAFKWRKWL